MKDRKLPMWMLLIAVALCAALIGVVIWQGSRLRGMGMTAPALSAQTSSGETGASALSPKSISQLIKTFDLVPEGKDEAGDTVTADVFLTLWDDQPDAAVTLLVTRGGSAASQTLTRNSSGVYSGSLTLPLSSQQDDQSISLSALVKGGGVYAQERLGDYPNALFMLASLRVDVKEGGMTYVRKALPAPGVGLMRINADCRVSVLDGSKPAEVKSASFRLYCNGERIKQLAAVEDETGQYLYGPQPWDNALVCQSGDEVSLTFACTGEDGLSYEFPLESASITEHGGSVLPQSIPPIVS